MLFLSIIGLLLAAAAWHTWGPIAGIIVGFLFVFGLGWKILLLVINVVFSGLRMLVNPKRARWTRPFSEAWERQVGAVELIRGGNTMPPGTFARWYRDYKRTGETPDDWIKRQLNE